MEVRKMGCHVFSCRSLLLSTTVLNDIPYSGKFSQGFIFKKFENG